MVRRSLAVLSLLVATVVVAGLAYGQEDQGPPPRERGSGRGGFGGGPGMFGERSALGLLRLPKVEKELNLTDEQKDSIRKLMREMRPQPGDGRPSREEMEKRAEKAEKKLAEILKPEQMKRYKEIRIQFQGPEAFVANPEVVKALKLTDDQQKKVKDIQKETRKQIGELDRPDRDSTPAERKEFIEKVQKIRKEAVDKCVEALTPDQQAKFKELRGKPFEFEMPNFGPRRAPRNEQPRDRSDL